MAPGLSVASILETRSSTTDTYIGEYFGLEFIETGTSGFNDGWSGEGFSGRSGEWEPESWRTLQERMVLERFRSRKPRVLYIPKLIEHRVRNNCK